VVTVVLHLTFGSWVEDNSLDALLLSLSDDFSLREGCCFLYILGHTISKYFCNINIISHMLSSQIHVVPGVSLLVQHYKKERKRYEADIDFIRSMKR